MNSLATLNPVILPALYILIILAVELIVHVTKQSHSSSAVRKDGWSLSYLWIVVIASIIIALPFGHYHIPAELYYPLNGYILFATIVALTSGILLRFWAIKALGSFFTVNVAIHHDHRLINKGPYALIRHPSYTGFLLELLGLSISYQHVGSICIIMIPSFCIFMMRIHMEERILEEHLGEEYRSYRHHTYALFPYVY